MSDFENRLQQLEILLESINELGDVISALNDPSLQSNYTEQLLEYSEQFDSLCESVKYELEQYLNNCRVTGEPINLNKYRLLKVINGRKV